MGRDYWYWTGKRVRGGGGGDATTPSGCMSSVFRFLDFHHFQVCYSLNHGNPDYFDSHFSSSLPQESLQGVEAPRNSFESEDALPAESASSIFESVSENLSIPHIKTKRRAANIPAATSNEEVSEDSLSSVGSRTPSLVARLMGLDLLPEASSPATSASTAKLHSQPSRKHVNISGTQSLPDSPRISLARWSDVDLHHRLSLQVHKEGNGREGGDEICKRRDIIQTLVRNSEAEGWSPRHYAKQIVKQVKENVSRRVGLTEITNTVRERGADQRRDEHLLAGVKTPPSLSVSSKKTNFRSGEIENQAPTSSSKPRQAPSTSSMPTARESMKPFSEKPVQVQKIKCRKAEEDRFKFTTCSAAASSKKKKPSSSTVNLKDHPATRTNFDRIRQVSDKDNGQRQLTKSQLETHIYIDAAAKTGAVGEPEIQYVSKILKCMGIGNHTRVNISECASPLNPSIFHLLEPISSSSQMILKCNRQLMFQLTDEILADIVRPSSAAAAAARGSMNGAQLVKLLTSKMASFPLSNCQVLQDVDALVGSDYKAEAPEGERGSVVGEVERELLDCLLAETAALYLIT